MPKLQVTGGKIWYSSKVSNEQETLIAIHGGPGYPSFYLEPLHELTNCQVVLYDQLGCGRSDLPEEKSLWRIPRFVEELELLRKELGLGKMHLLGHSWGAVVAVEYALLYPERVSSMILASPSICIPMWVAESKRLRNNLPAWASKQLQKGDETQNYFSVDYLKAAREYEKKHICRLSPKPEVVQNADKHSGPAAYFKMWGPNEFTVVGSLADYDCTERLANIQSPILFTCGKYDECTPKMLKHHTNKARNAIMQVFENSSHIPHVEEKSKYLESIDNFIQAVQNGEPIDQLIDKPLLEKVMGFLGVRK